MRKSVLLLAAVVVVCSPRLSAQEDNPTAESVTAQVERYEKTLEPLDSVLDDLESENLQYSSDPSSGLSGQGDYQTSHQTERKPCG